MLDFENYKWIILTIFIVTIFVLLIINIFVLRKYKSNCKAVKDTGDKRYLELVDLLPQMVVEIDSKGVFTFINRHGLDFLGYSKFELKDKTIHSIIHPNYSASFKEDFLYLLEGGENKGQEYQITAKNNKIYTVVVYLKRTITEDSEDYSIKGIIIDITKRVTLERKVLNSVLDTEDKERKRFSEDLHDGLGPLLSTIKLYVNHMKSSSVSKNEEEEMFNFANELLDDAITTTRNIANNILPGSIVDNGLIAAVRTFINHIKKVGNLDIEFNENVERRFDSHIETNLYRIIIELINNSIKYAKANKLEINISYEDETLSMMYKDDGVGFDIAQIKDGLGHINIKNRVSSIKGEYEYKSELNRGMSFALKVKTN